MKVLLADQNPERSRALEARLAAVPGLALCRPDPAEPLAEAVARLSPEVVIVDIARPDRDGLEHIRRAYAEEPRPIVMFVDADDPGFMAQAIAAGVCSYNVVGAALPDVRPIVHAAVAIFQRFRGMEEELRRAERALAERAAIAAAKACLMRTRGIGEADAYRWLRRRAMDRGRRIGEVAAELLADLGLGEEAGGRKR